MVPVASNRISRVRSYSGTDLERAQHFAYGALTLCGPASQPVRLYCAFVTLRTACRRLTISPTTPRMLGLHAIAQARFGLVPFRSPLLREFEVSFLSSGYLDVSVRLLTFPILCVQIRDDRALPQPGFPIRKSAGQRLFSASPRLIAAVHVLHRLLVPRHPPYALIILTEEHHISTMQISRCVRSTCPTTEKPHHRRGLSKLNSVRRVCTFGTGSLPGRHNFQVPDHGWKGYMK